MTRRILSGVLAVLVLALVAMAPTTATAQTPFAVTGLGQNIETGSARDTGRGGWGMAATDTLTPGTRNTAALADLRYAGLIFSGFGETARTTGNGESRKSRRVIVPNIRLALPLRSGKVALHSGFQILRSMEWESRTDLEIDHFGELVLGNERYRRTGTLWRVPVGLSWRLFPGLAVCGSANWVRGSISDEIAQFFTEPLGNFYLPNTRQQVDKLHGQNWSASVLLDALRWLQLGASYTSAYDLQADREISVSGVAERAQDRFNYAMPAEVQAGFMLRLPGHWRLGGDAQYAPYSEFSGREDWEAIMEDEWTLSAGFERTLVRAKQGRGYTMPLRVGVQYRQWAHTVGGEPVKERTISAGTGFPFKNRLGMIDISLSYSLIGDEARNGYESQVWRLGLSVTGLEPLVF